jgi:hypothetical protein
MPNLYSSLALSYRKWYYRMTTRRWDYAIGLGPAAGFAALQGFNVFSLVMFLPLKAVPTWSFVGIPFACGLCAFLVAIRIYRAHPSAHSYAKNLRAAVPSVREFPFVYSYLLCSLALFVACFYVAIQHAA